MLVELLRNDVFLSKEIQFRTILRVLAFLKKERRNFKRRLSQGEDWPKGEGRSDNDGLCQLARGHTPPARTI